MGQLPSHVEQLLTDLEHPNPAIRQSAATELGQLTVSHERIVRALEKIASAGGTPFDGSTQAAAAARAALQAPVHQDILRQIGPQLPVQKQTLAPTTNLKRLLILIGAGLLGVLVGFVVLRAGDYFIPWEQLPSPPVGTIELLTFETNRPWPIIFELVGRTAHGETYYYEVKKGWLRSDNPPSYSSKDTFEPCTYTPPEFGPFNNAPQDIISCVTAIYFAPEQITRVIFALDKSGNVWRWLPEDLGQAITRLICLGGFVGLLIGVWLIRRTKRRDSVRRATEQA